MKIGQEARDGVGNFAGGAAIAYGAGDGGELANAAAYAEIVGVDHLAVLLDFFSFEADIGNPVLAAGVGAAGDVELDFLLIAWETFVELFGEPAGIRFCFGESELAEFGAGAGHGAADERVGEHGQASLVEFIDNGGNIESSNIDEEEILHGGGTEVTVTVMVSEIGGEPDLRRGDATADDVRADGEKAGLLLRDNAQVIAMDGGGELFGGGGIEFIAEFGFDGG